MSRNECDAVWERVVWDDPGQLASLIVLLLIDVMVIVGNCLVIAAVFISSKLRSVTNLFIVSLAVADLMVGVTVLPFSATWEVFKVSTLCFQAGYIHESTSSRYFRKSPGFIGFNPLKPELNPICYLLALLGAHHFLHVSRIRVKLLTFRLLMSYIYIWSTHS